MDAAMPARSHARLYFTGIQRRVMRYMEQATPMLPILPRAAICTDRRLIISAGSRQQDNIVHHVMIKNMRHVDPE